MMTKYNNVTKPEVGTLKGVKANIKLQGNATPKFMKARSVPYALRAKAEEDINHLVQENMLKKVDHSQWSIIPVLKSNGKVRICGDFKMTINLYLCPADYPIPRIEDIFASLSGGEKSSKIDLAQAYNQIELEEESKTYVTVNTPKDLFYYQHLPFGISTTPPIFQKSIEQVLQGLTGVHVYFDDILVTSKDDMEHLKNL